MTDQPPRGLASERLRWDRLAQDPYYAVLNDDGFRLSNSTDAARARFDASGEADVATTLEEIRRFIDPAFRPPRTLDFGCGVGRLTVPLAHASGHVVGIDISRAMLEEARSNCAARGAENVSFATSAEYFAAGTEAGKADLDFVHSYIVLQHIPPTVGLWVIDALVRRLRPGGVGALHVTYARHAPLIRRLVHRLRRVVPGLNVLANAVQRRPLREPLIPMHRYDLGALVTLLSQRGCGHVHMRPTDHGGHHGAMLLFQRR